MENKSDNVEQKEIEKKAATRANSRARVDSWDLNSAMFLFLVLITVIILLFYGVGIEIVAPVTISGLTCVWIMGHHQRRKLYSDYYKEELNSLVQKSLLKKTNPKDTVEQKIEETIEEYVQEALRTRCCRD